MAENVSIVIKAFDKTKPAFGAVGSALKGITASIFSMKTALIGVGGVTGFGYLIKKSLDATDTLSKTANKIGTTTEALGGLRYAAEITGVSTNTMDMALQRFTRRTAEAAKGTGEAKGAIKELRLNAQELNRMPLDQRMIALADAFGKVDNESDQLRLAFKLFDSEGAALVNTLALGSDGLKELLGEAKMLGLTMSTEAAQGVEKANDSITKLLSIVKGLKDQFSAALAPAIDEIVTKFTNFIIRTTDAEGGIEKLAQSMAVSFLEGVKVTLGALDKFAEGLDTVINKANDFFTGFETRSIQNQMKGIAKEMSELGDQIGDLEDGGIPSIWEFITDGGLVAQKADIQRLGTQYVALYGQLQKASEGNSEFASSLGGIIDMDDTNLFFDDLLRTIQELGEIAPNVLTPLVKTTNDLQVGFKSWSDSLPSMQENIQNLTKQGLNGMTDALTAGVTGAANFADAMKSMAKSVVDSLIKMLIQKYIVDAAFGAITGFFDPQTRINSSAGYGSSLGGADPFNTSNFAPRAIGGSVQNGAPYMVGERGPEMFVPNSQGSIVPNNRIGGGGVTVNQTINVTTGVQQTVRAEIATLMPQIANAAKGAVAEARMRGGNYSKMLGA